MLKAKKPKPKKCPICNTKFTPDRPLQIVCSPLCAIKYQKRQKENQQKQAEDESRRKWRKRKADAKPLSHWKNMTQRVFNDYIRARDRGNGCISCGINNAVSFHAGHFRTTKAASQLRFNEDNVHLQCSACNVHKSGDIGPYRLNLIKKIGLERVIALESNHEEHRYTREELDGIRTLYRKKLRDIEKQHLEAA